MVTIMGIPLWEWIDLHEMLNQSPQTEYWTRVRNYPHVMGFTEEDYQLLKKVLKEE